MTAFGVSVATPLIFSLAGAGAGVTEAILVNPFEVVKVTLQSNRSKVKVIVCACSSLKNIEKYERVSSCRKLPVHGLLPNK